jgi:hypothetical protein
MMPSETEINRLSQKNILHQKTGQLIEPHLSGIKVIVQPDMQPRSASTG